MSSLTRHADIAVIILASGSSQRMQGRDKLLENIDGQPLLQRLCHEAKHSKANAVYAVVPDHGANARELAAIRGGAQTISNPDFEQGQSASIRLGIQAIDGKYDAAIIMLGDMPDIRAHHINMLIDAYYHAEPPAIIRLASAQGQTGNPVLFDQHFFKELKRLTGDQGAKSWLAQQTAHITIVAADDDAPVTDLDTIEDWKEWRGRNERSFL